jgi:hypothetical protein
MIKKLNLLLIICLLVQFSVAQTDSPNDSRFYERQAIAAYQSKDFAAFLENMKRSEALRPNHPRLLYNLAAALALNGRQPEAVSTLDKLARMKLFYAIEKDDDFAALKNTAEFQALVEAFRRNAEPTANAKTALTVREKGLVPESVAFDAATKTFYLAGVAGRKILRVNERGESKIFADRSAGLWSVFGIKVDSKRRLLWAATSAHEQMPGLQSGEDGQAGIFAFDLKTGKLVKKYLLPNQTPPHLLGDLAIAPNGDVYATDSRSPDIFVVRAGKNEIELFLESKEFVSLQGLDFSADGRFLYAADYSKGIFRINLVSKEIVALAPPPDATLLGIDGIYFEENNLIAIQNGVEPQRIVRLTLAKNSAQITGFDVLEANNPLFDDLTLGVLSGREFFFIADSQWNLLGNDGKFAAPATLRDIIILKMSLNDREPRKKPGK